MVNLQPSTVAGENCFKCRNYNPKESAKGCALHGKIEGISAHKCGDFAIAKDRWHTLRVQAWEYAAGIYGLKQTTLEAFICP